jgi:hypothetical protein
VEQAHLESLAKAPSDPSIGIYVMNAGRRIRLFSARNSGRNTVDWLFDWTTRWTPEQWQAFGTMATAVIAIVAALYARQQVIHARRLREDQTKPFVTVSLRLSPTSIHAINLVIENIGSMPARNVQFAFDRPLASAAVILNLNEAKLFKDGIPVMPPGMRFQTLFDLAHVRKDSGLPVTYRVKVSYDGIGGKREVEEYVLDVELFYGLPGLGEYGLHQVAKSLEEISKILQKWNDAGRLRVSASDSDYESWSKQWQYDRAGKYPSLASFYPAGRSTPSKFDSLREPLWKRFYGSIRLRAARLRELREDKRLVREGRSDLVVARKQARGEI